MPVENREEVKRTNEIKTAIPLLDAIEIRGKEITADALLTPRRFARLQRKYGRWGLAYLESLVRAADYAASELAEKQPDGGAR